MLAAYFRAFLTRSLCAKSLPPAWPRFAFCVLRQIGILVLICLFFICLLSMDYKEKNRMYNVFLSGHACLKY